MWYSIGYRSISLFGSDLFVLRTCSICAIVVGLMDVLHVNRGRGRRPGGFFFGVTFLEIMIPGGKCGTEE